LVVFRTVWVLGNDIESEFGDRRKALAGVLLDVPDRIFPLQGLDLMCQRFNLCEE